MGDNILAIGAHPDDIELGCGGTIAKHLELGDNVFVLIMTNGEIGKHSLNRQECLTSLKLLGVKESNIIFGNFPDGNLLDNYITVDFIEKQLKRLNITKVYTHDPHDRHQDHRKCSLSVSSAARKIPEIFLFQGPSTNPTFEPHYFIELSQENFIKKMDALNCYDSQIKKGSINLRLIKNLAELNGAGSEINYAEAFAVNHMFRKGKNV
ncbi:MAG: PIG-L deacetylase family protein [Nanoarchaeota archaeon]|nr:PIG-L deacetylase family protein [Nanoarchaeota archaeon]